MPGRPDEIVSNTDEMVVVHKAFRREFGLLPQLIRAVPDGDTARADIVAKHGKELVELLYHHHTSEDEELWPRLTQRVELERELVARMQGQHEMVNTLLEQLEPLLATWRTTALATDGEAIATVIEQLNVALGEHLDEEEQRVLPIVRQHITNREWAILGKRGIASMPKDRVLVFLGYLLEDATPAEREHFLAGLPLPPKLLYKAVGRRKYEAERDQLRAPIGG
jgi:hemerythrin-like domain-containing protein